MRVETFARIVGVEFYTGVPDSRLKALCDYLMDTCGINPRCHLIGANEGNCTAIAAGYHLATGKTAAVYLQNSGMGNLINPAASLLSDRVYAIPALFIIGWRGEPGVHDEPQHICQGQVTLRLLEDMDIKAHILSQKTTEEELETVMADFQTAFAAGKSAALVVRKGALTYDRLPAYRNSYVMTREDILRHITAVSGCDPIVSTTGKASRELFELREAGGQGHQYDFLTVGSMGHSSSIALGIAANKPDTKVWCVDGDGAALMHMGAMAVMGSSGLKNVVHVVINNEAHETVGGMPTAAGTADLAAIARACGYPSAVRADTPEALDQALREAKLRNALSFIEVKCAIGARADLGRPTTTVLENKTHFMEHLSRL